MKSRRFRKIVSLITGVTLFFCVPFCSAAAEFYLENELNYVDGSMDISHGIPENATGVMDRIKRKGVLRVATEPYFAPQEFIDPEKTGTDQYAGADMELARLIALRMGVELEIVPMEYTQVLPALTDNLVDLTISAIAFTPRRAAAYTMSKGYYFTESAATTAFVIREADRELYTSVEDLSDKTLIVQSSSLQEALVAKNVRNYRELRRVSSVQTVYEAVRQGRVCDIHIKLDTGMGRIGFPVDGSMNDEIAEICKLPGINPYGIFSHFAVADTDDDEYTMKQFESFTKEVEDLKAMGIEFKKRHICNSAGIMRFPNMHMDMVRAGLILYGYKPAGCPEGYTDIDLKPVMTWYSKVVHVKTIPEGTTVSYGRHFVAKRPTKVVTVSVGYADGLSRRLSNGFELIVNGQRLPIIGNVCMDMCMLDATDMEGEVKKGDIVTIFGKGRPADELAEALGTISYEITCDVGKRVQRIFVD